MKAPSSRTVAPLLSWVGLALAVIPLALPALPRLIVGERSVDFGHINQGEPVSVSFTLENSGADPLVVERMEFSMPGMNARVQQLIEPGESTQVVVTLDTSRLRGKYEGRMTLHLNDPVLPEIVLSLTGTVVPAIEFMPMPALYFSQFSGESQTKSITLKNNQARPLAIERLSSSNDRFDYRYREIEPGRVFELTVSTRPDTPPGRFRDSLFITTSHSGDTRLHVEVNILVKPDVFVSAESVAFGTVSSSFLKANPGALDFIRQTLVINRREGKMRIMSLTTDVTFLTLRATPEKPAESFMIEIGIDCAKLQSGPINGSITLRTDDPENPELVIPVSGLITD